LVTQSGPCGILTHNLAFSQVNKTLGTVFKTVHGYATAIPSFVDCWGFNIASDIENFSPNTTGVDEVDSLIQKKIKNSSSLRYYDGISHTHIFSLPKPIRKTIQDEKRIFTAENIKM